MFWATSFELPRIGPSKILTAVCCAAAEGTTCNGSCANPTSQVATFVITSHNHKWLLQGGSGTELEPETGTVGTVLPETESGTGTAGTVFQEPKPEPGNRSFLLNCTETHRKTFFLAEEPPEPKTGTA